MLSIVIVNYKNPQLLRLCLKTIQRELGSAVKHEVVVVDVASQPESRNVVQHEFPNARLLAFRENLGYTRGNNRGLEACQGDYILVLNPDIIISKESTEQLLRYLKGNPDIGLVGPKLLNFDGSKQDSCFRYYTPLTILYRRIAHLPFAQKVVDKFLMRDVALETPTPVDWLMGSAFMTSRQAVEKVGLMDEQLFMYFSDVDWPRRFWENGYKVIYHPEASFYHYHRRDSKGRLGVLDAILRKETRWHIADAFRYFRKWGFIN